MNSEDYDPLAAYSGKTAKEEILSLGSNKRFQTALFGLLLCVATALLYGHSLWNPLVFDDKPFFTAETLRRYGESLFHFDLRWFAYASFGWTYDFFGSNWFWYRAGNLVLHALTTLALFFFFQRVISAALPEKPVAPWPAFFGALVFALHPASVYGVAYLVERSTIMATLFGILSLLFYLRGLTEEKRKWFVISALCYFLSVFSKEHAIMIPGVAVMLTLLLHKPGISLAKKLWLPFSLYLAIGLFVLLRAKGVLGSPYEPFAQEMLKRMSEGQQVVVKDAYALSIITEGYLFFKYLLLWILPNPGWMSVDLRQPFAAQIFSWPEAAGFILYLIYPVLAMKLLLARGRKGLLGFGMLFPWVLYLTEFSAVRIQEPFVLYRSYLWMSGLPLVILAFWPEKPRKFLPFIFAGLCLLLAALAWGRLETFSSNQKLWADVVAKNRSESLLGVERGYNNLGFAKMEMGDLSAAAADFRKAVSLNPKYPEGLLNMGIIEFRQKKLAEAMESYNLAIKYRPEYGEAYLNRGVVFLQMQRREEAFNDFEHAATLEPGNADVHLNRGLAYSSMGKAQEAISDYDDAININPELAGAYLNRGIANAMLGRGDAAIGDMEKAVSIDPKNAEIYYNRGIMYGSLGRIQEAMQDYSTAIELKPDYANAHANRGALLMMQKKIPEAMAEFDRAIQLDPNQENAHLNRANLLASQSHLKEALQEYDKVISLNPGNGQARENKAMVLRALQR